MTADAENVATCHRQVGAESVARQETSKVRKQKDWPRKHEARQIQETNKKKRLARRSHNRPGTASGSQSRKFVSLKKQWRGRWREKEGREEAGGREGRVREGGVPDAICTLVQHPSSAKCRVRFARDMQTPNPCESGIIVILAVMESVGATAADSYHGRYLSPRARSLSTALVSGLTKQSAHHGTPCSATCSVLSKRSPSENVDSAVCKLPLSFGDNVDCDCWPVGLESPNLTGNQPITAPASSRHFWTQNSVKDVDVKWFDRFDLKNHQAPPSLSSVPERILLQ